MALMEQMILLSFSREQEMAADRFGAELLARVYGHLGGAQSFFENLKTAWHEHEGLSANLISTHPVHEQRIKELSTYATKLGVPLQGELRILEQEKKEEEAGLYPAFRSQFGEPVPMEDGGPTPDLAGEAVDSAASGHR